MVLYQISWSTGHKITVEMWVDCLRFASIVEDELRVEGQGPCGEVDDTADRHDGVRQWVWTLQHVAEELGGKEKREM